MKYYFKKIVLHQFLLLLTVLIPLTAMAEIDTTSVSICGKYRDSGAEWSWENIQKRYAVELTKGNYQYIYWELLKAVGTSAKQADKQIQRKFYNKLSMITDYKANGRVTFDINVERPSLLTEPKKYFLFKGDPDQIDLQNCASKELKDQLDELRDFAIAVVNLSDIEMSPARQQAIKHIQKLEETYDRYLFEGYPMFPWEAAINSTFLTQYNITDGPPRNQLVFFHLGAGFEINTESMSKSELGTVVSVEPLGWINYPISSNYRKWWGVSTLTTFRQDMGIGVGLSLHFNAFSLGTTWHERDAQNSHFGQPYIFIGLDLYRYMDSKNKQYEQYKEKYNTLKKQYLDQVNK